MMIKKVIKISRLKINDISSVFRISPTKANVLTSSIPEELCIKVPADLEISSKYAEKVKMYTAKLSFLYKGEHFDTGKHLYIATLSDGQRLLIGGDSAPFPVETTTQKLTSDKDNCQLIRVNVTYTSPLEIATLC